MGHRDRSDQIEKISSPALQFDKIAFLYEELMRTVPYQQWLDYLEKTLDKFMLSPSTILDLCCGTGSMSRLLSENGYTVTGVDISAGMIEIAERRSESAGYDAKYFVQDAAKLHLGQKFDLVISLFDSLNYILDSSDLQQAFYRVSEHLRPGGMFIFDMNTELALAIGLFNQDNLGSKRASVHYNWHSSYDKASRICRIHMDFMYRENGADEKVEVVHYQRAYDEMDVVEMLINSGLRVHAVYDAYTFAEANPQSDRVFYICRK